MNYSMQAPLEPDSWEYTEEFDEQDEYDEQDERIVFPGFFDNEKLSIF